MTSGNAVSSAETESVPIVQRRPQTWTIPISVSVCYLLFALAVHLRVLDSLDLAVRRAIHVGQFWGTIQVRASQVVYHLQPRDLAVALGGFTVVLCAFRRSPRPLAVVLVVGLSAVLLTFGSKWVMAHSDSRTTPVGHGAFPSGHTVTIITVFGLVVILLRTRARWAWILPTAMGLVMGTALLLAWVHSATDVIGAGLLSAAVLAAATAARLGQWARAGRRQRSR
jgi:membrane-associated phospholipid phosphatase